MHIPEAQELKRISELFNLRQINDLNIIIDTCAEFQRKYADWLNTTDNCEVTLIKTKIIIGCGIVLTAALKNKDVTISNDTLRTYISQISLATSPDTLKYAISIANTLNDLRINKPNDINPRLKFCYGLLIHMLYVKLVDFSVTLQNLCKSRNINDADLDEKLRLFKVCYDKIELFFNPTGAAHKAVYTNNPAIINSENNITELVLNGKKEKVMINQQPFTQIINALVDAIINRYQRYAQIYTNLIHQASTGIYIRFKLAFINFSTMLGYIAQLKCEDPVAYRFKIRKSYTENLLNFLQGWFNQSLVDKTPVPLANDELSMIQENLSAFSTVLETRQDIINTLVNSCDKNSSFELKLLEEKITTIDTMLSQQQMIHVLLTLCIADTPLDENSIQEKMIIIDAVAKQLQQNLPQINDNNANQYSALSNGIFIALHMFGNKIHHFNMTHDFQYAFNYNAIAKGSEENNLPHCNFKKTTFPLLQKTLYCFNKFNMFYNDIRGIPLLKTSGNSASLDYINNMISTLGELQLHHENGTPSKNILTLIEHLPDTILESNATAQALTHCDNFLSQYHKWLSQKSDESVTVKQNMVNFYFLSLTNFINDPALFTQAITSFNTYLTKFATIDLITQAFHLVEKSKLNPQIQQKAYHGLSQGLLAFSEDIKENLTLCPQNQQFTLLAFKEIYEKLYQATTGNRLIFCDILEKIRTSIRVTYNSKVLTTKKNFINLTHLISLLSEFNGEDNSHHLSCLFALYIELLLTFLRHYLTYSAPFLEEEDFSIIANTLGKLPKDDSLGNELTLATLMLQLCDKKSSDEIKNFISFKADNPINHLKLIQCITQLKTYTNQIKNKIKQTQDTLTIESYLNLIIASLYAHYALGNLIETAHKDSCPSYAEKFNAMKDRTTVNISTKKLSDRTRQMLVETSYLFKEVINLDEFIQQKNSNFLCDALVDATEKHTILESLQFSYSRLKKEKKSVKPNNATKKPLSKKEKRITEKQKRQEELKQKKAQDALVKQQEMQEKIQKETQAIIEATNRAEEEYQIQLAQVRAKKLAEQQNENPTKENKVIPLAQTNEQLWKKTLAEHETYIANLQQQLAISQANEQTLAKNLTEKDMLIANLQQQLASMQVSELAFQNILTKNALFITQLQQELDTIAKEKAILLTETAELQVKLDNLTHLTNTTTVAATEVLSVEQQPIVSFKNNLNTLFAKSSATVDFDQLTQTTIRDIINTLYENDNLLNLLATSKDSLNTDGIKEIITKLEYIIDRTALKEFRESLTANEIQCILSSVCNQQTYLMDLFLLSPEDPVSPMDFNFNIANSVAAWKNNYSILVPSASEETTLKCCAHNLYIQFASMHKKTGDNNTDCPDYWIAFIKFVEKFYALVSINAYSPTLTAQVHDPRLAKYLITLAEEGNGYTEHYLNLAAYHLMALEHAIPSYAQNYQQLQQKIQELRLARAVKHVSLSPSTE